MYVFVEVDYCMKFVGIGLEEGVLGVDSYFDWIGLDENGNLFVMDVVWWWFLMNYDVVVMIELWDVYEICGMGVWV